MRKLHILTAAFLFIALNLFGNDEMPNQRQISTIHVTGDATVASAPDQVTVDIGVISRSAEASQAASQNAQKLERVLGEIRKLLGDRAEVKTVQYSLVPNYTYPPQGGQPKLTDYTASNTIQVKTDQLTNVGKLIDVATQAGANNVDLLSFGLKDEAKAQAEALKQASQHARTKAEAIAESLGLKIRRIVRVEEGGTMPIPFAEPRAMLKAEAATPIEAGKVETRAQVTLTVEIE
jgi:uncharacterized protein YggE